MRSNTPMKGRGFTLVELLIMLFIVALLIGLLTVGMRYALRAARGAAGTQDVAGIKVAIESFRNDHGFVPPLVKDGFPGTPGSPTGPLRDVANQTVPWTYQSALSSASEREDDREYLKEDPGEDDFRFSNYSLAYYLMGQLPKEVDGVAGPEAKTPKRDGSFDRLTQETYPALYAPRGGQVAYAPWTAGENQSVGRWELQDRNGVAYRYYRWLPAEPGDTGYSDTESLENLRVPKLFGDALNDFSSVSPAAEFPEFRGAEYVIVAAGADGVFGDLSEDHGENYRGLESFDEILDGIGRQFVDDPTGIAKAENEARSDNIVEVGR